MSAQIADFNIRFNADSAKFQKDVDYAKKMLRGYTKEASAANDSTGHLDQKLKVAGAGFKEFGSTTLKVTGMITAGFGTAATASAYLVRQSAQQAREIERMATVAQVSVEQIQALGYASKQYSISGDKMADILKDVNDKLGDFAATGGGEFKDFFEEVAPQVGLTVEELQRLSGPEALVAIKTALDAANVPMKQQIFYLESIANDASALMPLLENKGDRLYELTKRYDDLNVAMSEYDIEKFKEMDQKLEDISLKLQKSFSIAVVGASDQLDWLTDKISYSVSYWGTLLDSMSDAPKTQNGILKKLGDARDDVRTTRLELERAQEELKKLESTQNSATGDIAMQAHLANAGFDKKVEAARAKVQELTKNYEAYSTAVSKFQRQYEDQVLGFNRKPPSINKPPAEDNGSDGSSSPKNTELERNQAAGAARLSSLDSQYANERGKLLLAHEQRLIDIENLQVSEQELTRRGYETMDVLKAEYKEREDEFYLAEQEEFQRRQDEAIQRELDAFTRKEDEKTKKAEQAARQRAETEQRLEQQMLGMKMQVASQTLGLIEQTAKEGSVIQKAAFLAQKAMAAAQVYIQGEVAAMAAMSLPPVGLGPIAGAGMAASIRMMAGVSAGMIIGQGIAGMAHDGIGEIPAEGTWLLNKGERVYTNDSASQLDQMYKAVMAMYTQRSASNDPSMRFSQQTAGMKTGGNVVNIFGAPEGTRVEKEQGSDGEEITNVFLADMDADGPMSQAMSRTFGMARQGV
ncbi:coiled-coil domain-containing protein [Vibrio cyclitrophicus]|uniref:Phage tail length tape-measure protein 1 n=1 Tax=Vibrio sp. 1F_97 TaxID=1652827 RepID=A0A0H3ZTS8_9VIBR|nr:hypothetical protein [Vibrio cyclitrophicus]AKN39675.1 hypothetical protein [Vibrio sp. 1F_97]OEF29266.1 hypothetical protein OA9_09925 [Vibrio cyclitrophicus 1F97]